MISQNQSDYLSGLHMESMNYFIFQYIFALSENPYIANIALFFSYYLVFVVIGILIAWSIFFAPQKVHAFSLIFFSGLGSVLSAELLKVIFLVNRPFISLQDIIPLVRASGFSFPSVHAALMAGLAAAGFFLNKKLGAILAVLAILVGLSRIVIGVHYPVDILGGWLAGSLVALLFVKILKKYE